MVPTAPSGYKCLEVWYSLTCKKTAKKFKGIFLNSYLETGPNLLNNMFGLPMRFREKPIAVSGDIEGRFIQICMKQDNQSVLRLLWPTNQRIEQYQNTRLDF